MPFQYSDAVIHANLDAIETAIGASPTLVVRSGTAPVTTASADSGTLIATIALPADFMNAAAGRTKTKLGTWTAAASAAGIAGHFRIKQGATTHIQGPIAQGAVEVAGELVLINTNIAAGQIVTVNQFDLDGPAA